jgi:hypothetical protein
MLVGFARSSWYDGLHRYAREAHFPTGDGNQITARQLDGCVSARHGVSMEGLAAPVAARSARQGRLRRVLTQGQPSAQRQTSTLPKKSGLATSLHPFQRGAEAARSTVEV